MLAHVSAKARTLATVRVARLVGIAHRRGVIPRALYPHAIENSYGVALAALVSHQRVASAFAPLMHELPQLLASAKVARGDGRVLTLDTGEGKRVRDLVARARAQLAGEVHTSSIERLAEDFANQTSTYQRIQLNRQTQAALGVDVFHGDRGLRGKVEGFNAENVSLIKDLPERISSDVEKRVQRALTSGTLHSDLADELEHDFGFGERRSKLIARDQIGKLYGQVNASRQQDIGITSFIWRTVGDERVRDEHEELDGEQFEYENPPDEGLPGEPILCRCSAEPVFDDILGDLDGDDSEEPASDE